MPAMFRWTLLLGLFPVSVPVSGQTDIIPSQKGPVSSAAIQADKESRGSVELRFVDGSKVRMAVLQQTLDIVTKYGKLTVPVRDIRKIEFGLHVSEEVAKQVEHDVQSLASNVHAEREAAGRQLVELGYRAYPAIHAALKSKDPEVARRAELLVRQVRETVPAHLLRLDANDRIDTAEFPIVGRIDSPTMKTRSLYFGEKDIKIEDLLALHISRPNSSLELTVDAAKYGSGSNQWLDTGVDVEADMDLNISASGQVDLTDGKGGQVAGPAGAQGMGAVGGGGGRGGRSPGKRPGALVARIGDAGETFFIGEQHKSKSPREGKLYLQIIPGPFGVPSSGTYSVKISTGGLP